MKETPFEQARSLHEAGYFIGPRDPERNKAFEGAFMVCQDVNAGPTDDARRGGYCVVGHDLDDLIVNAYRWHFEDNA